MDLNDRERRLIELLRSLYCADLHVIVEKGVLVRAERLTEKVLLDQPVSGQLSQLELDNDYP